MSRTLLEIPTKEIVQNPLNPRMEFSPITMDALRKSIAKVGILVPLTVYQRESDGKYCLVDGERRWRCALELDLKEVPAVVIPEPDEKTNLLQMFSIHHLRVQWKLIWTALKLETLMLMMDTEDDEELSSYTGMSLRKIDHCKRILYFPKRYQEILLLPVKDEKIKSDFFVELYPVLKKMEKEMPAIRDKFSEEQIIDSLMQKFRRGQIHAAREFRTLKDLVNRIRKKQLPMKKAVDLVERLITDPDMDIMQISRILTPADKLAEATVLIEHLSGLLTEIPKDQTEKSRRELQKAIEKLEREIQVLVRRMNL